MAAAHSTGSFLHSCLKVPIDPCNNCPAPIYNRPRMYLGRLTTTPLSARVKHTHTTTTTTTATTSATLKTEVEMARDSAGGDIRSLAKLYDSIPDYCDINHLPPEEFYSTLDTLRSTCCHLKTKPLCVLEHMSCTATSSISSSCSLARERKTKKQGKKKGSAGKNGRKKKSEHRSMKGREYKFETPEATVTPCNWDFKPETMKRSRLKSFKEDFEDEVEAFKKSLKDLEQELKQRPRSVAACRSRLEEEPKVTSGNRKKDVEKEAKKESSKKKPFSHNFREPLKKSYSFNDLNSLSDAKESEDSVKTKPSPSQLTKTHTFIIDDGPKLSSYFALKVKKDESTRVSPENALPQIVVESASTKSPSSKSSSRSSSSRKKKAKSKKYDSHYKLPFSLFELSNSRKENIKEPHSTPSPVHPVARPNLAATLRVEVSKKKLKELQNNCTFHDSTPQFDWEVRKTPAWKSLSLNEPHKEILSIRLATRKAEQALQKREYDLHMELMRQRVKSAPLLLEGPTYWGPNVGKLTHNCQREGVQHLCESNQRKLRKKSGCSSTAREGTHSVCSQRLESVRKIYGCRSKSQSRNSHNKDKTKAETRTDPNADNDSGDELSSLDRAFL